MEIQILKTPEVTLTFVENLYVIPCLHASIMYFICSFQQSRKRFFKQTRKFRWSQKTNPTVSNPKASHHHVQDQTLIYLTYYEGQVIKFCFLICEMIIITYFALFTVLCKAHKKESSTLKFSLNYIKYYENKNQLQEGGKKCLRFKKM